MDELINVTDHWKNKIFQINASFGKGIPFPAKVLQSYDFLCLCEVTKAFETGPYRELLIAKVGFAANGEPFLSPVPVDFETRQGFPARSLGTDEETREMFDRMVAMSKTEFYESEVRRSRKQRELEAQREAESLRLANISYIKDRQAEINSRLSELCAGGEVKKLASNKKIIALLNENFILESLKKIRL